MILQKSARSSTRSYGTTVCILSSEPFETSTCINCTSILLLTFYLSGGFEYWLATYKDMLFDWDANDQAWQFWSKKTRERIKDPRKRDILAPTKAPHAWGTKRPSLEQNFYEVMDQPNNDVVDIKNNPVVEVKENGIVTEDGQLREFDIIVMATGFDSVTGGMKNMGLKDENGTDIKDKWADGTLTYMGMALAGYPNMFFLYGAQGPTAFSNGPSCVELQGEWIVDAIEKARKENITYLNAKEEDEEKWRLMIKELNDKTLFPYTNSWYMGKYTCRLRRRCSSH